VSIRIIIEMPFGDRKYTMDTASVGRVLVLAGLVITFLGITFMFVPRMPFLGKLPGDLAIQVGDTRVFFPLATCLILSLVLTIVLNFLTGRR
jgi:hypothetical protein